MMNASQVKDDRPTGSVGGWVRKQIEGVIVAGLALFLAAWRLDWTWGWVQVGICAAALAVQAAVLIPRSPDLLAERSRPQKGTKGWDMALLSAMGVITLVLYVAAGLDERFGWSASMPLWAHLLAAAVWLAGYGLITWSMAANAFFSETVRIQDERGQRVASGGPYRAVRHPGYVGTILFDLATPFLLGSWWALIPAGLIALVLIVRTALEDRTLRRELDGYENYTRDTRFRLIPGVW
jgi:protein-S-isoprenylcysteine O-methyltransferase Ste14